MNAAHIHLMLNHIPVMGMFFSFLVLVYSQIRRNEEVTRAAFLLFVVVGVSALPVYLSGDEAHHLVGHLPGVKMKLIHEHEEAAETAAVMAGITGVLALGGLFFAAYTRQVVIGLFIMSVVGGGTLGYAAKLGGEIRHQEVRSGFASTPEGQKALKEAEHEEHAEDAGHDED